MTTTRPSPSPSMRRRRPWSNTVASRPLSAMSGSRATGTGPGFAMTGCRAAGSIRRRGGSGCPGSGAMTATAGMPMAATGGRKRSASRRNRSGHDASSIPSQLPAPSCPCRVLTAVRSIRMNHRLKRRITARPTWPSLRCQSRPASSAGPSTSATPPGRTSQGGCALLHPLPRPYRRSADRMRAGVSAATGSRRESRGPGPESSHDKNAIALLDFPVLE